LTDPEAHPQSMPRKRSRTVRPRPRR
jgi:hypothetical protein